MDDAASGPLRVIDLPSGGRLEVRMMTLADADLLDQLYGTLSAADLRRRFFTAGRPSRRVVEYWAAIGEHGGFGVIAIAHQERVRPVAEAGYALLDDGFGELAITVVPDWRGWLGPFLVEVVAEHAAACGIPGLKAEILTDNTIMRRVLGHRGAVVAECGSGTMLLATGPTTRVAA
jgi:RimJ/RimL family protein N-acetyltransferase